MKVKGINRGLSVTREIRKRDRERMCERRLM